MNGLRAPLAVYIHWPFCAHKCPYCDFNSHVRDRIDQGAWASAYLAELAYYRAVTGPRRITSVFFGGGTPSLMDPGTAGRILESIDHLWGMDPAVEITLEANPTSAEQEKFKAFKQNGINRLSIGLQALNDPDLKFLGRQHSAAQGCQAVAWAAGIFDRFSFDLIYARPNQTLAAWEQELETALTLARGHLSLYQLTIEEQTPFYTAYQRREFSLPAEHDAAEFYARTDEIMTAHGMPAYEISNYAAPGQESRHNLTYWRYDDYLGIGPGAHGRLTLGGVKWATRAHRAPEVWLQKVDEGGHGAHAAQVVPTKERAHEMMLMGLRLVDGVQLEKLAEEIGQEVSRWVNTDHLDQLIASGDVVVSDNTIRPTLQGRLRLNAVLDYLLRA